VSTAAIMRALGGLYASSTRSTDHVKTCSSSWSRAWPRRHEITPIRLQRRSHRQPNDVIQSIDEHGRTSCGSNNIPAGPRTCQQPSGRTKRQPRTLWSNFNLFVSFDNISSGSMRARPEVWQQARGGDGFRHQFVRRAPSPRHVYRGDRKRLGGRLSISGHDSINAKTVLKEVIPHPRDPGDEPVRLALREALAHVSWPYQPRSRSLSGLLLRSSARRAPLPPPMRSATRTGATLACTDTRFPVIRRPANRPGSIRRCRATLGQEIHLRMMVINYSAQIPMPLGQHDSDQSDGARKDPLKTIDGHSCRPVSPGASMRQLRVPLGQANRRTESCRQDSTPRKASR